MRIDISYIYVKVASVQRNLIRKKCHCQKYGVVSRANWVGSFAGSDIIDIFMLILTHFYITSIRIPVSS